jgi:hypothetical protein
MRDAASPHARKKCRVCASGYTLAVPECQRRNESETRIAIVDRVPYAAFLVRM